GQAKLLRVLESGQFERIGSSKTRKVKVRVISATNADVPVMIRDGRFREDLLYRLNVIELRLPPLAERSDDILPLAEHFLDGAAAFDDSARVALVNHGWPGNVRELKNAIQRAALLCQGGVITARDLGLVAVRTGNGRIAPDAEPDREMIEAALKNARGVISQAASELGLSRQALYRRMDKLGVEQGAGAK
ncbi:MAG: sigma 54-interacting transcriptional regulator, partial [Dokdonella sp.]|uniref:sigma 54-interacting transcriptional regulator n=1 Tax=Dokdonella sp. TaxID=2291710 RepID=UPI00326481B4